MSYVDYQDCMQEISINLAFESYKGIIGNSYATDAAEVLNNINPLNHKDKPEVKSHRMTKADAMAMTGQTL